MINKYTHSDILNRLQYHESTYIRMHGYDITSDDDDTPTYPNNGQLEFDAFGKVKKHEHFYKGTAMPYCVDLL